MNDDKKNTEQIFYMLSIAVVVIGGVLWLANINSMATANTSDIRDLKAQEEIHRSSFEEIRIRLTHIEDAVIPKKK